MSSKFKNKLLAVVKSMRVTQIHSDLVFTCDGEVFNVHKNIVCAQSEFFAKAVSFLVDEEAEDSKIDLSVDDPDVVKLLVQFFYEAEYDPVGLSAPQSEPHTCDKDGPNGSCWKSPVCDHHACGRDCYNDCEDFVCENCLDLPASTAEQLLTHVKVYAIADKYNVDALKDMAAWKFQRACKEWWNDAKFIAAARLAYATVPENGRELGDTIENSILRHPELLHKPEIKELLDESNGLALGLLQKKVR